MQNYRNPFLISKKRGITTHSNHACGDGNEILHVIFVLHQVPYPQQCNSKSDDVGPQTTPHSASSVRKQEEVEEAHIEPSV